MTPKRCTDCRHARGIGFDFWCGEGHTEYEVFGAETNCPYYEYHDWSKGVPSMTAKRFECDKGSRIIIDNKTTLHYIMTLDWECSLVTKLLNDFADENEQLKQFKQNVFGLINEKITFVNECEKNHNDIGIPHEYYRGADEILNLLKKELEE